MTNKGRIAPDWRSKPEWLAVSKLEIEPSAQRAMRKGWAKKLAVEFDRNKMGRPIVVVLTERGAERYAVIDGQHRIEAVRIKYGNEAVVECDVIRGMPLAQAAAMFIGRNSTLGPQPMDRFLVGITAEDPNCLAINRIVTDLGLVVARGAMPGTIQAVSKLIQIYRDEQRLKLPGLLRDTISLALSAWGREAESFSGEILRGIALVLARYGSMIDRASLEERLRQHRGGVRGLLGRARGLKDGLGGSAAEAVARTIRLDYNKGRRKNPLPEWGAHMENGGA